ncbi:MAG: DUF1570 domain-containing protein [Verrucomicrobiota bacterium]
MVELSLLALSLAGLALGFLQFPAAPAAPASNFQTLRTGNYKLTTDAPPATAQHTLELLTTLRQQFLRHFAALIQPGPAPGPIDVVYFSHEAEYRASVLQIAPGLVNSAGLFSPQQNRLLLLDQFGSADYVNAQQKLITQQRRLATLPGERHEASVQLAEMRTTVASEARVFTTRLTRHEGAHQLFHAYAIESPYPVAPTWLTEGLAQYCEADEIGTRDELLIRRLKSARTLLPLRQLLNHRDPAGFFSLGDDQIPTAYAQSWALTYFLMQPGQQPGFFSFINHYRAVQDPGTAQRVREEDTAGKLAELLGLDYTALENEWQEFLAKL